MSDAVKAYYESKLDEQDPDFESLGQGPDRTKIRHDLAAKIATRGDSLLDVGCGTGLILDSLHQAGKTPGHYLGIDILPEREEHVVRRLEKYNLPGGYRLVKPGLGCMGTDLTGFRFDTGLAIGIVGLPGCHTYRHLLQLFGWMVRNARKGLITLPKFHGDALAYVREAPPGGWAPLEQTHYDTGDVEDALAFAVQTLGVVVQESSDREIAVHW